MSIMDNKGHDPLGFGNMPVRNDMLPVPNCDRDKLVCPYSRYADSEIERLREQVAALQASSGYEACIAQVEIERLRAAVERVVWFDWSGNDADAVAAIDDLRRACQQSARGNMLDEMTTSADKGESRAD